MSITQYFIFSILLGLVLGLVCTSLLQAFIITLVVHTGIAISGIVDHD